MPTHASRGFEQHYDLRGSGPPLVWAHGMFRDARKDEAFFGFYQALAQEWQLLTFDARGHGYSAHTPHPEDYTAENLSYDLEALLQVVGFERASFVGGSMGSLTTLSFALRHPSRVKAMVLFQPTAIGEDVQAVSRLGNLIVRLVKRQGLKAAEELVMGFVMNSPAWVQVGQSNPEQVDALRQGFADQAPEAVMAAVQGITMPPLFAGERLEALRELDIPTLLIAEPDDPLHPRASAETLARLLPRAELVVAPHTLYYFLHRDQLLKRVTDFLRAQA